MHCFYRLDISGASELPLMNLRYNVFLGGVPEETRLVSGSVASDAPFIGCIRDVLVKSPSVVTDFNAAPYHTGVQLGTCVASTAKGRSSSCPWLGGQEFLCVKSHTFASVLMIVVLKMWV